MDIKTFKEAAELVGNGECGNDFACWTLLHAEGIDDEVYPNQDTEIVELFKQLYQEDAVNLGYPRTVFYEKASERDNDEKVLARQLGLLFAYEYYKEML